MTEIAIVGIDLPPYSIRGATQTLELIDGAGQMARTVNGALIDISATQFRKFRSTISCNDQQTPALAGVWPGQQVTVDCAVELSYRTTTGAAARPIVESRVEGDYTFYRPRLEMRVVNHSVDYDEWNAAVAWSLDLEEI